MKLSGLLGDVPPVLTLAEFASFLRISKKTAARWIAEGRVKAGRSTVGGSGRVLVSRDELARVLGDLGIAG